MSHAMNRSRSTLLFASIYAAPTPTYLTTAIGAMQSAYTNAAGRTLPDHIELATGNIGGLTLPAGLYKWSSAVTIPANVTLVGGPADTWIFQIAGGLTPSAGTRVILSGGALAENVVWQVAGVVTMGTTSRMEGRVFSPTAITLGTGARVNGCLYAQTAVSMASSTIHAGCQSCRRVVHRRLQWRIVTLTLAVPLTPADIPSLRLCYRTRRARLSRPQQCPTTSLNPPFPSLHRPRI